MSRPHRSRRFTAGCVALVLVGGLASWPATANATLAAHRPEIRSLSLKSGTPSGGSDLVIRGRNIASARLVTIGGKGARILGRSTGEVVVATPTHKPGVVQVRVTTKAGTSSSTRASQFRYFSPSSGHTLHWSKGRETPNRQGGTIQPSCPTATFCVAADGFGNVVYFDGSSWSTPRRIDTTDEMSISCPTATFCMATDNDGRALSYDGTRWSSPRSIDAGQDLTVSCGSPTLCVATTLAGDYLSYNGTRWTAATPVPHTPAGTQETAISCSGERCVAGTSATRGSSAELLSFNGTTWTDLGAYHQQNEYGDPANIAEISCPTAEYCFVGDDAIHVATLDGTSITHVYSVGAEDVTTPLDISCGTSRSCLLIQVTDGEPEVLRFDRGKWSGLHEAGNEGQQQYRFPSCVTTSFCMVGGSLGVAKYLGGASLPSPKNIVAFVGFTGATGTSCVSATFCMNTDHGVAFAFDGVHFGASRHPTPQSGSRQSSVSCVTKTFCVFVSGGRSAVYNGTSWTKDTKIDGKDLLAVSCGSRTLCVAYDARNRVLVYDGTKWTTPKTADGTHTIHSVSCAGRSLCVLADNGGGARSYHKGHWTARTVVFTTEYGYERVATVSCGSSGLCMAIDVAGDAARFDGTAWQRPVGVAWSSAKTNSGSALESISCVSGSFCRAFADNQAYSWNGTSWSTHQHVSPALVPDTRVGLATTVCATTNWCFASDYVGYRIGTR